MNDCSRTRAGQAENGVDRRKEASTKELMRELNKERGLRRG